MKIFVFILSLVILAGCSTSTRGGKTEYFRLSPMGYYYNDDQVLLLLRYIDREDADGIGRLIDSGLNINRQGTAGMRPLFWALCRGRLASFCKLLQFKPDLDIWMSYAFDGYHGSVSLGEMALQRAETVYMVELLNSGLDANYVIHKNGETLIFGAIKSSNVNIIKELIARGADLERKNQAGYTPVVSACILGEFRICSYLIDNGVDIGNSPDHNQGFLSMFNQYAWRTVEMNPKLRDDYEAVIRSLEHRGVRVQRR